jgi:hypothetical protein
VTDGAHGSGREVDAGGDPDVELGTDLAAEPTDAPSPGDDGGGGVAVVQWPAEAAWRDELVGRGLARLLVVAEGAVPPLGADALEDWVRADVDPVERYIRTERLRRRQAAREPAVLDEDGVLRRGSWWVALSPREVEVATVLLARPGVLVGRAELEEAVSSPASGDRRRLTDAAVRRFHRRIAPLGLRVHTMRSAGFLLEMGELPA